MAAELARVARTLRARRRRRRRRRRRAQPHRRPACLGPSRAAVCLSTLTVRLARFSLAHAYCTTETVDGSRDGRRGGRRVAGDGVGGIFTFKSYCTCAVATQAYVNVCQCMSYICMLLFEKLEKYI